MKPLIVGEAPGPNGDPEKPLDGRPAGRLLECMGIQGPRGGPATAEELSEHFEIRNLIDRPMERGEGRKGCEWPKEEAKRNAKTLALLVEKDRPVVLLGKRVATAFILPVDKWWGWTNQWAGDDPSETPWALLHYTVVPHPSGIVRLWNDPVNRVLTGMVLWQALGKIPK